jgi:hypothetical protein
MWGGDLASCQPATQFPTYLAPDSTGVVVHAGDELPIRWNGAPAVDIDLSRDNGTHWETIARAVPGQLMSWTVTPPAAAQCRLRVRESGMHNRNDSEAIPFQILSSPVGVEPVPLVAALSSAWPNPTRGAMRIQLSLPKDARTTLVVYDLAGRVVRRLVDGELAAGVHPVAWDGKDERGARVSGGVYFVRARWAGFEAERRVVMVH